MRVTCGPDSELDGALLAKASGQLDVHGATQFWEAISPRVGESTPKLLLDMTGVEYMTSAGIGILVKLLNHVQPFGGGMSLFGCNDSVRRVLQITELESLLHVCDSIEEAREELG